MRTTRLTTICLTILLIGVFSSPVRADDDAVTRPTLKGIDAVTVVIETLPNVAKKLGLTKEMIQTDVESKLRLAGIRVVTEKEALKLPGQPYFYVNINLSGDAAAANIDVELRQNVLLQRTFEDAVSVPTWSTNILGTNPTGEDIRDETKDQVDFFLKAWVSANLEK